MKKKALAVMLFAMIISFTGCGNKDMFDTNYTYNRAIIDLQNGEFVDVEVKQWTDYDDGEQIQIISTDGTVYLVSSYNCTLIREK